jgi:hypothetical protein
MDTPFQIFCESNDSKLFKQQHKRSKKESGLKKSSYFHKPRKARQEVLDKKHNQSCQLWKVKRAKARGVKNFIVEENQLKGIDLTTTTDAFENYLYKFIYDELWEDDNNEYKYDEWDERSKSYSDYDDWDYEMDNVSLTFSCGTRGTRWTRYTKM